MIGHDTIRVRPEPPPPRKRQQLCRYITRSVLANERVQCNSVGQVVLKLKTAWRDGTMRIVMSPLELMQCLVALVQRQRLHFRTTASRRSISPIRCLACVDLSPKRELSQ